MPDSASTSTLWWTFVAGILAVAILLSALGAALVIYQRRYVAMHRAYAHRLLEAQEEERAWVAREVHDDALQRIALIRRECDEVRTTPPPLSTEQSGRVSAIQEEMLDLGVFLRGLAHRLHPALIDRGGLHAALGGLAGEVERAYHVQVETRLPDGPTQLDAHRALAVFRIAQEALRNVATHSGAQQARLSLAEGASGAELVVADEGRGFEPRERRPSDGLGLIGMRERATLAGGTLTITSGPGRGTTVRAVFPK